MRPSRRQSRPDGFYEDGKKEYEIKYKAGKQDGKVRNWTRTGQELSKYLVTKYENGNKKKIEGYIKVGEDDVKAFEVLFFEN